ncbi:hypothetical protein Pfo_003547, partial [Paulownia fortunei]
EQSSNSQYFYYFDFLGVVGVIDGTLILNMPQNVLAIYDFDLMFTYVYIGWEGSANDACVLFNAISSDPMFPFPPLGKYYLVDARFMNYMCFLLVIACCVLYNFIRKFSWDDTYFNAPPEEIETDNEAEVQAQVVFRDGIANAMWEHNG